MRKIITACIVAFAFSAVPFVASAEDKAPTEKKCDKTGKECKDGADCKKENCKK